MTLQPHDRPHPHAGLINSWVEERVRVCVLCVCVHNFLSIMARMSQDDLRTTTGSCKQSMIQAIHYTDRQTNRHIVWNVCQQISQLFSLCSTLSNPMNYYTDPTNKSPVVTILPEDSDWIMESRPEIIFKMCWLSENEWKCLSFMTKKERETSLSAFSFHDLKETYYYFTPFFQCSSLPQKTLLPVLLTHGDIVWCHSVAHFIPWLSDITLRHHSAHICLIYA